MPTCGSCQTHLGEVAYSESVVSERCLGEAVARVHDFVVPANHGVRAGGGHAGSVPSSVKVLANAWGVGVKDRAALRGLSVGPGLRAEAAHESKIEKGKVESTADQGRQLGLAEGH